MITGIFRHQIVLSSLVLLGLLISCGPDKKPVAILSQQEMVKAMIEIYVNEQKVARLSLSTDSAQVVFDKMKGKVFENTGVPDSLFKKSFDYYIEKPVELEQIYAALVDSLNLHEQRLNVTTPPIKKDRK